MICFSIKWKIVGRLSSYERMVEKREIEQELADALEKSRPPIIPATTRRERDEEGASNHREAMNQILKKLAIKSQENMKKSKDEMTRTSSESERPLSNLGEDEKLK